VGALSPTQVAEKLGVHKDTVLRLLRSGRLPAVKLGHRTWRITEEALQSFITGASSNTPSNPTVAGTPKKGKNNARG
jgi:excisionase family DNA binding protein